MRTDWEILVDGDLIMLHPNEDNPLIRKPEKVLYLGGYFYLMRVKKVEEGPDFYFGDVALYNDGFDLLDPLLR